MNRIVTVLLLSLICSIHGHALAENPQYPSWFDGTILIQTMMSETLQDNEPTHEGICVFDFPEGSSSVIEIPFGSVLLKDHSKNQPIILYQRSSYYGNADIRFMNCPFSLYSVLTLHKAEEEVKLIPVMNQLSFDIIPIRILGIEQDDDPYCIRGYYLSYGISDKMELEIQLVCERNSFFNPGRTVLFTFPPDTDFSRVQFKISNNGIVAISQRNGFDYSICICNNGKTKTLGDSLCSSLAIDWIDNSTLAYFAYNPSESNQHESELKYWNIDTNEIGIVPYKKVNQNCSSDETPLTVSIDESGKYMAMFFKARDIFSSDPQEQRSKIRILSLKDGESFDFIPWTKQVSESYLDYSGPRNLFGYGLDEKGIIYYDPFDVLAVNILFG